MKPGSLQPSDRINRVATVEVALHREYFINEVADIFNPENRALCYNGSAEHREKRLVVVDAVVWEQRQRDIERYFDANRIAARFLPFESGEQNKSLGQVTLIWEALDAFQIDRRFEPVIGIGGGVLVDVAGFAASTYRRGIPFVRVPTTLMAMVDAAVGVKTGFNFAGSKNRVGSFTAPLAVLLDWQFLSTLPRRHIANGVGEIVKLGVICDQSLFQRLEGHSLSTFLADASHREILRRAVRSMLDQLAPNLFEDELARAVDFGHTFSTFLEMSSRDILHGEAVSMDIALSTAIAEGRGLLAPAEMERVFQMLRDFELPTDIRDESCEGLWRSVVERTLHRGGKQNIPLPGPLGHCSFINDLTEEEMRTALRTVTQVTGE